MRSVPRSLVVLLALVGLAVGCSDDDSDGAPTTTGQEHGCAVAQGGEVTLVARDSLWDVPCIQAPEGNELTITVDNRDEGVAHNLHLVDLPGEPGTSLQGGPTRQSLSIGGGLAAGEYDYVCDIHPAMTGTLEILAPLSEGAVTDRQ